MKANLKNFLVLFYCMSLPILSTGQMDNQWYILDKEGLHVGKHSEQINNRIVIDGINEPNTQVHSLARDDIFIIYTSGSFFSSRNGVWNWNYLSSSNQKNKFGVNGEHQVEHMYFTNVYDINDDLPEVRVSSDNIDNSTPVGPIDADPTISASHDVVPGTDITLILKLDDLPNENHDGSKKLPDAFYLRYTGYTPQSNVENHRVLNFENVNYVNGLFDTSAVFNSQAYFYYPFDAIEHIEFIDDMLFIDQNSTFNGNYLFINLRSTELLSELVNEEEPTSSVFEILKVDNNSLTLLAELAEHNNPTHDPNEVYISGYCKDSKMIRFKGQFYNNTQTRATGLALAFRFSDIFDPGRICIDDITVENKALTSREYRIETNKDTFRIIFDRKLGINIRDDLSKADTGFVKFEFCAKLNKTIDEDNLSRPRAYPLMAKSHFFYNERNKRQSFDLIIRNQDCVKDSIALGGGASADPIVTVPVPCRSLPVNCKACCPQNDCQDWPWWNFWSITRWMECKNDKHRWKRIFIPGVFLLSLLWLGGRSRRTRG